MSATLPPEAPFKRAKEPHIVWVTFILASALLHAGLWWIRDWFALPVEDLPKPPTPIEVSLVPAPAIQSQSQSPSASTPAVQPTPPPAPPPKKEPPKPRPTPKPKAAAPKDTPTEPPPERSKPEPTPAPPAQEPSAAPSKGPDAQPPRGERSEKTEAASSDYVGPKPASHMNNPKPAYPSIAIRRQWEGKVSLKVFVKASGQVGEVQVANSSGHEVLDEAAVEAVRQWRFVPAKRGGQAVDSWVTFPINWNLENSR